MQRVQLAPREPLREADLEEGAKRETWGEAKEEAPLVRGEGQVPLFSANTRAVHRKFLSGLMTRIAVAAEEETAEEETTMKEETVKEEDTAKEEDTSMEEETAMEEETGEETAKEEETAMIMRLALCRHGGLMRMVISYTVVNKTLESNEQSP